ncbi:6,7-dimethyl-8-ribityllumazine synthase [Neisseria weaveri]|uniref:6,7-dimethyl-8-ribityllumazine synthase n=2 Tax=Neisseria weaveri TaxID=28091 RepID=A0A3S4Z6Q9_9NEIS|nr:6,7-dimethyl-8-ribityllumazine synthase [Neisseria weaveri]
MGAGRKRHVPSRCRLATQRLNRKPFEFSDGLAFLFPKENMNIIEPNINGKDLRIGIVQARFSNEIGSAMVEVCTRKLQELGVKDKNITLATVPGALEVPIVLQNMASSERFDALIAIGAVIRGETYHFELVANESGAGVTRVSLDYNIPIANAILTTENDEQAHARIEEKAADAAVVAVECGNLVNYLLADQLDD